MGEELLYTQEDIDEWIRTCEELQEKVKEQEETIEQLSEYKSLEEQSLLIRLPATLNKPVYIIMGDKNIKEMTVLEYYIVPNGIFARLAWIDGRHNMRMTVPVKELNKCYVEAEKKLKEIKGDKAND